jgi:hypothetical protein
MKSCTLRLLVLVSLFTSASMALSAGPLGGARPERTRTADAPERTRSRSSGAEGAATARSKPTGENLSEQQKTNLQTLQADLAAIKAGSTVTSEQKVAVKTSLAAIADGATKPSEESVAALSDSLTNALSDQSVSAQEKAQITKSVQAVLQSANVPQAEVGALLASTSALLTASGLTKAEVEAVANDLRAIAAELKANASAVAAR